MQSFAKQSSPKASPYCAVIHCDEISKACRNCLTPFHVEKPKTISQIVIEYKPLDVVEQLPEIHERICKKIEFIIIEEYLPK